MESITDLVVGLTNKHVVELANQILFEIRAQIDADIKHPERSTGAAKNSFSIGFNGKGAAIAGNGFATGMQGSFGGGFLTSVTIGSNEPSAYYLDQGNGGPGAVIKSTRSVDSRGMPPAKLHLAHIGNVYAASVKGYSGTHYIKTVADKHR